MVWSSKQDEQVITAVGWLGSEEWRELAGGLAERLGVRLVSLLEVRKCQQEISCIKTMYAIVEPQLLDEAMGLLLPLAAQMSVGYLTAATLEGARRMAESLPAEPATRREVSTLAVLMVSNGYSEQVDEHTYLLARVDCKMDDVLEQLRERPDIVVLDGHADGIRFHLTDGDLCHPSQRGTLESLLPERMAEVVVLNVCAGIRPDDITCGEPLGLTLLEQGVKTMIATPRVKGASVYESALAVALLKAGVAYGEVVHGMNQVLQTMRVDFPEYVLLGDPLSRLCSPQDWEGRLTEKSITEWQIESCELPIVRVPLVHEEHQILARQGKMRIFSPGAKNRIYYGVWEEEEEVYLVLFSWGALPKELKIKLYDTDALFGVVEYANLLQEKTSELEVMRLCRPNLRKGPMSRLLMTSINASKYVALSAINSSSLEGWFPQKESMFGDIEETLRLAGENNLKYARIPLTDRYEDRFQKTNILLHQRGCPYCGMTLRELELMHPVAPVMLRTTLTCAVCGVIEDRPEQQRVHLRLQVEDGQLKLVVEHQLAVSRRMYGVLQWIADEAGHDKVIWKEELWVPQGSAEWRITMPPAKEEYKWVRGLFFLDLMPWYFSIPAHRFH